MAGKAAPVISLFRTAKQLQEFCDEHAWKSCFIGGIAVQRWGEPRVTRNVDLSLLTGFGGEPAVIDVLSTAYPARIGNAKEFALRHRVLLLKTGDDIGIDISLGALPYEERVVERASVFSFGAGLDIRNCSGEDLIVLKLFASRPLDIHDAESVVLRQKDQMDWDYIENQLRPL